MKRLHRYLCGLMGYFGGVAAGAILFSLLFWGAATDFYGISAMHAIEIVIGFDIMRSVGDRSKAAALKWWDRP